MTFESEGATSATPHPAAAGTHQRASLLETVLASLEDSKAEEIVTIDITGKSSMADQVIVASGRSHRHVGAISDHLARDLKEAGHGTAQVEGAPQCDWVLIDAGDVIVHVFRPEVRAFYNIEKMWSADMTAPVHYAG
ncbi:ribosome silencing factor [Stappia sp.]|jgi:ribosome-associated protein|uniref:ribosome silencing factor n=1 Tax=Stappia sp. TaxID=1870903 RepID=UPI003A98D703